MRGSKLASIIFIFFFALLVMFVLGEKSGNSRNKKEVLVLPELRVNTIKGFSTIRKDSLFPVMILYFSPNCNHCEYELKIIEKNIEVFSDIKLFLITVDKSFFTSGKYARWKKINAAPCIKFCIADAGEFLDKFGSVFAPSIYFFDRAGSLSCKLSGESKIEKLKEGVLRSSRHLKRQ